VTRSSVDYSPKRSKDRIERISYTRPSNNYLDVISSSIKETLYIPPAYTTISEISERKFEFEKNWKKTNDHINEIIKDIKNDVREILDSKSEIAEIIEKSCDSESKGLVNTVHKNLKCDDKNSDKDCKSLSSQSSYENKEMVTSNSLKDLTVKGTKEQDYLVYDN